MELKILFTSLLIILAINTQTQPSISDFLLSAKKQYEQTLTDSDNSKMIHVVMGNESADLDSIVSSIAYA
jgi:hypothetical protein